ncbi:MAG: hypothetical protein AAFS13_01350 [Pseudomonadota bacterium]
MNTSLFVKASILPVLMLGAQAADAQEPPSEKIEKVAQMLKEADANKDGKTSRDEFKQHRSQMFAKLDRNDDGTIDASDRPRLNIGRRKFDPAFEKVVSIFDDNSDKKVTSTEWNRTDPDVFGLLDRNGDDLIEASELPKLPE